METTFKYKSTAYGDDLKKNNNYSFWCDIGEIIKIFLYITSFQFII